MNITSIVAAVAALTAAAATPAFAQDHADIDRTQIIGNRELPKVLYIVPWKKPMPGDMTGRPLVSVLDEALAPVDRDVFRRQVSYDGITQTQATTAKAQAQAAVQALPQTQASVAPAAPAK
jgi:hypothetical protein